ncbi:hypothetical protein ABZ299_17345 [Streptomyces sp. NPDC006184]|uniref:hypothetical protein n=1 Tax=Streptomyces sp. NPDC006184 TaxID=3155455 RepID=UPI0033A1E9C6
MTDEQAEGYGKFAEEPTRPELERFFFLDDEDLKIKCLASTAVPVVPKAGHTDAPRGAGHPVLPGVLPSVSGGRPACWRR